MCFSPLFLTSLSEELFFFFFFLNFLSGAFLSSEQCIICVKTVDGPKILEWFGLLVCVSRFRQPGNSRRNKRMHFGQRHGFGRLLFPVHVLPRSSRARNDFFAPSVYACSGEGQVLWLRKQWGGTVGDAGRHRALWGKFDACAAQHEGITAAAATESDIFKYTGSVFRGNKPGGLFRFLLSQKVRPP